MAHVIIRERIYDNQFITDYVDGFEDFAALVLEKYSPDLVAGLTGVPANMITRLAREFAGSRPAVAIAGRGLEDSTNALFNHLAIHSLNALAGSINVPGGILRPPQLPFTSWEEILSRRTRLDGAGSDIFPLAVGAYQTLPERITNGQPYTPQILFLYETNPIFESPAAIRWQAAFERIPTIVSFSSFLDESTLHADLVLPNHTYLERWVDGIPPGGMGQAMVGIGGPTVQPVHDTRHTGDILLALADAIGGRTADHLPWTSFEEMLRFRTQGLFEAGGSIQAESFDQFWDALVNRGVWVGAPYEPGQRDEVLATESGRFQLQIARLKEMAVDFGMDQESLELPTYSGDEQEYPLLLIPYRVIADAGCRAPNAPLLWEMYGLHPKEMWHNWVEINPETAHHLEIEDGDYVWVESPQARIRLVARIYEGAMPDAVSIPLGGGHTAGGRWANQVGGGNASELVVPQTDPLIGTPAWCGTRVRVYKAQVL
jgi:anaerobic selenocysteine-containing dehydrogenase